MKKVMAIFLIFLGVLTVLLPKNMIFADLYHEKSISSHMKDSKNSSSELAQSAASSTKIENVSSLEAENSCHSTDISCHRCHFGQCGLLIDKMLFIFPNSKLNKKVSRSHFYSSAFQHRLFRPPIYLS